MNKKNPIIPSPPPTPTQNKTRPIGYMLAHLIGWQEFLCLGTYVPLPFLA
jgi:hypothetical protein